MSQYNCQHCSNDFATEILLIRHQNTAKYCLELQGKEVSKKEKQKQIYKCSDCNSILATKQSLINHANTCKVLKHKTSLEKDKEIENLKKENNDLKTFIAELQGKLEIYKDSQDCLKEIAKQPKTVQTKNIQNNHNNINNKYFYLTPLSLTQEIIKQKIEENFTEKHLIEGQKGVAIFTYDNLLLDDENNSKYLCGDISRQLFYYKNDDGTIQKDPKATNLTKMIAEDVIAKSHNMVMGILDNSTIELLKKLDYQNIFYDIKHLRDDNGKFISNLSLLTSKKNTNNQIKT